VRDRRPCRCSCLAVTVDWIGLDVDAAFGSFGPVIVESDVRAASIAEARFGAGADVEQFVYLTVGTGIAYTLMLSGVPHRGRGGAAILLAVTDAGAQPVEVRPATLGAASAAVGAALLASKTR